MSQELEPSQQKRFETLESICKNGRVIFFMVGQSLDEIKRERYYEAKGFKTFADYCESIGYSRRHADRLILDAEVISALPENLRSLLQTERSARELARIPEQLRLAVVEVATAGGQKPASAAQIKKANPAPPPRKPAQASKPASPPPRKPSKPAVKPVPPALMDATGVEIPKEVLDLWKRLDEAQALLTYISSVRGVLKKAQEEKDILFVEVDFTDSLAKLNQVYADLQRAKPYAVCPTCQGKLADKNCLACSGRGFVSEFYWKNCVPNEAKEMRKK